MFKNKAYRESVKEALDYTNRGDDTPLELNGSILKYMATYTAYDFTNCNHPVLFYIENINQMLKEYIKETKKELQAIKQPTDGYENGEPVIIGGSKKIIIDIDEVKRTLGQIVEMTEELISGITDEDGIFTVNAPVKIQTMGIKITKK